jgi:hypothetical protein
MYSECSECRVRPTHLGKGVELRCVGRTLRSLFSGSHAPAWEPILDAPASRPGIFYATGRWRVLTAFLPSYAGSHAVAWGNEKKRGKFDAPR